MLNRISRRVRRWYEEHVDVKELIEELRKNVTVRKENYLGIAIYKGEFKSHNS